MGKRIGKQTLSMDKRISIHANATIAGREEAKGPLGEYFDIILQDELWGEKTWEVTESKMFYEAIRLAVKKSGLQPEEVELVLGGDLLAQLISSSFAVREMELPFLGLYGACSTMAESLCVGAMILDGGFANNITCCVSSHFCTAERQFRFPLELGCQTPPTSQRTVTGAGACILQENGQGPFIKSATVGKVVDYGIKDANDMGAAMAPAAADTIATHLEDTQTKPSDYDMIVTGDLGKFGLGILSDLLNDRGIDANAVLNDCGAMMFSEEQDAHMGGSGCGCSAITLNGYLIPKMRNKELNRILFVATGALLSPVSTMQGESIPGIAHAVHIESEA